MLCTLSSRVIQRTKNLNRKDPHSMSSQQADAVAANVATTVLRPSRKSQQGFCRHCWCVCTECFTRLAGGCPIVSWTSAVATTVAIARCVWINYPFSLAVLLIKYYRRACLESTSQCTAEPIFMNSKPLIPVKRCKVFESCCRGAMSRCCSSVRILAELLCSSWVGSAGHSFDVLNYCAYSAHTYCQ